MKQALIKAQKTYELDQIPNRPIDINDRKNNPKSTPAKINP